MHCELGKKSQFCAHRLVWALHHGDPGDLVVDHIDEDRANNTLENLQAITGDQNNVRRSDGRGYYFHKASGKFQAYCGDGKGRYLGLYDTEEEAREAFVRAKREIAAGLRPQI